MLRFTLKCILSMFPLLSCDRLILQYVATLALFGLVFYAPRGRYDARECKSPSVTRAPIVFLSSCSSVLHVVYFVVQPPQREGSNLGFMGCSGDNSLASLENFPGFPPLECLQPTTNPNMFPSVQEEGRSEGSKREAEAVASEPNSSAPASETPEKKTAASLGGEVEKGREAVHARAGRGQAANRHRLAERRRREMINERMRRLQGLVPGCCSKARGMVGILDEIIDYVQSLQNRVKSLSTKPSAASSFHDFSSDMEQTAAFPRDRRLVDLHLWIGLPVEV